jgi:hypothetical protein
MYEPDIKTDLNQLPWPFENDEFQHIVAKDILDQLGSSTVEIKDIIKEMYRVSENGAVWEVQVPHHRSDLALANPTPCGPITPGMFELFNRKNIFDSLKHSNNKTPVGYELDIDLDVCEVKHIFNERWLEMIRNREINEDQLQAALSTQNNVADYTVMLIQIHKPGRYTVEELKAEAKRLQDRKDEFAKSLSE